MHHFFLSDEAWKKGLGHNERENKDKLMAMASVSCSGASHSHPPKASSPLFLSKQRTSRRHSRVKLRRTLAQNSKREEELCPTHFTALWHCFTSWWPPWCVPSPLRGQSAGMSPPHLLPFARLSLCVGRWLITSRANVLRLEALGHASTGTARKLHAFCFLCAFKLVFVSCAH